MKNLFGTDVSYPWAQRFIQRHLDGIKTKKTKLLASKRVNIDILKSVDAFIAEVENYQEKIPIKPHTTVNYDETMFLYLMKELSASNMSQRTEHKRNVQKEK